MKPKHKRLKRYKDAWRFWKQRHGWGFFKHSWGIPFGFDKGIEAVGCVWVFKILCFNIYRVY